MSAVTVIYHGTVQLTRVCVRVHTRTRTHSSALHDYANHLATVIVVGTVRTVFVCQEASDKFSQLSDDHGRARTPAHTWHSRARAHVQLA
jgi:hypothetical protein